MSVVHLAAPDSTGVAGRDWNAVHFRLIFAVAFLFHIVAAIAARFTLRHWRAGAARRSIFAEAWDASGTTAQIAFSG